MEATSIFVVAAVAGFIEMVNRVKEKDYWTAVIIAGAGAIGAGSGLLGIDGLTPVTGLVAGLAASGLISIGQRTAKKISQ